jgi:hypothetical protein
MAGKLKSVEQIVKKMLDRTRGQGAEWEAGLDNARGTITSNMKAANPRYKAEMGKALSEDRWLKSLGNLTDDQIIAAAKKVGGSAWESGITSRDDKIRAAWQELLPRLQAHVDRIRAMPNVTDGDREKRMIENRRGMIALGLP